MFHIHRLFIMLSQKHSKIHGCDTSKAIGEDWCLDKWWDTPYSDDFISEKNMLEDEIAPGILHDQICYLLVHDARESSCVACTFWVFSLILCTFLSITSFLVIHAVVPSLPQRLMRVLNLNLLCASMVSQTTKAPRLAWGRCISRNTRQVACSSVCPSSYGRASAS